MDSNPNESGPAACEPPDARLDDDQSLLRRLERYLVSMIACGILGYLLGVRYAIKAGYSVLFAILGCMVGAVLALAYSGLSKIIRRRKATPAKKDEPLLR